MVLLFADLLSSRQSWNATQQRARTFPHNIVPGVPPKESIFIASTLWNNEAIIRDYWSRAVIDLAKYLGPDRVYVSVYESGSYDHLKDALRALDAELESSGTPRTFVLDPTTHAEEIAKPPAEEGWIDSPRGKREMRRSPYLARARNLSLRPLEEMARAGRFFDKILFLNDVVFTVTSCPCTPAKFDPNFLRSLQLTLADRQTADVVNLLNTRDGDYAAACSLDFSKPPHFYDTFALRDAEGRRAISQTFPYFESQHSRRALLDGLPVPVQSCWNGMGQWSIHHARK